MPSTLAQSLQRKTGDMWMVSCWLQCTGNLGLVSIVFWYRVLTGYDGCRVDVLFAHVLRFDEADGAVHSKADHHGEIGHGRADSDNDRLHHREVIFFTTLPHLVVLRT